MSDDFGFSLVSEEELRKHENELKQQIDHHVQRVQKTIVDMNDKLNNKLAGVRDMIMPLLNNLAQSPEKDYIYWPGADRTVKIQAFIEKFNTYIKNDG